MFVLIATKPLNDRTKGFRFNVFGLKGMTRKRKIVSRGYRIRRMKTMLAFDLGKRTVYFEQKSNRYSKRQFRHWAG